jgi:hypothetical protein
MGSVSIGRVYYHGASLMKVLYSAYPTGEPTTPTAAPTTPATDGFVGDTIDPASMPVVKVSPGANRFWLNLGSDLFNQPMGLGMFFQDASETYIGANYLESCYIQGHQLSINAGSILLMEGATIQYDRSVPIKLGDNTGITLEAAGGTVPVN